MVQLNAELSIISNKFLALLLQANLGRCSWLFAMDFRRVTISAGSKNVIVRCLLVPVSAWFAWRSTFYLQQALLCQQRATDRRNSLFRSLPSLFLEWCLDKTLAIICIKVKNLFQLSRRSRLRKPQSTLLGDFWWPPIYSSLCRRLLGLTKTRWLSVIQSFGVLNWHWLLCFLLLNEQIRFVLDDDSWLLNRLWYLWILIFDFCLRLQRHFAFD